MKLIVININRIMRGPQHLRRRCFPHEKVADQTDPQGNLRVEFACAAARERNIAGGVGGRRRAEPDLCKFSRARRAQHLDRQHWQARHCARDHPDDFARSRAVQEVARRMTEDNYGDRSDGPTIAETSCKKPSDRRFFRTVAPVLCG